MNIRIYVTNDSDILTNEKFQQHVEELKLQDVTVQICEDEYEEIVFLQQKKRKGLFVKVLEKNKPAENFFGLKYSDYVFYTMRYW